MGVYYYLACFTCKRWIELEKNPINLTNSEYVKVGYLIAPLLSWSKVQKFEKWLKQAEEFHIASLWKEEEILQWLKQHWEHKIVNCNDLFENEPFVDYNNYELKEGWKQQIQLEIGYPHPWVDWDKWLIWYIYRDWAFYGSYPNMQTYERHIQDLIDTEIDYLHEQEATKIWKLHKEKLKEIPRQLEECLQIAKKKSKINLRQKIRFKL